jgi:protein SCO1/2
MSKRQKLITIGLWAVLILALNAVVLAFAWERLHPVSQLPVKLQIPHFALTDQDGKRLSDQDLRGKPWVAAFIFTGCADTCPMMSKKMSNLQTMITAKDVKLVSFTVDPDRDTPAVLKQYAARFNADTTRWKFVTGTAQQMKDVAYGMGIAVQPPDGNDPLLHSQHFLLIDGKGQVRGIYDNRETAPENGMQQLAHDATELAKDRSE